MSVCLSGWLAVTFLYCFELVVHIVVHSVLVKPIIPVFCAEPTLQNSDSKIQWWH